eukprot:COSAG01_NODE_297_length_19258_cov_8.905110_20_plen_101_part_00
MLCADPIVILSQSQIRPESLPLPLAPHTSSSITQMHLTAVMGPLCLATPTQVEVASTDPRRRQRPSRPSAWRLWGPLLVSPTIHVRSPTPRPLRDEGSLR